MAGIITREGVILQQDTLSDAQNEEAWAIVLRAFLRAHPEVLTGGHGEAASAQAQS